MYIQKFIVVIVVKAAFFRGNSMVQFNNKKSEQI